MLQCMATFISIQTRGNLVLPAEIRKRHHLDEPGAQVEVIERDDGVIELRPHVAVPADQAWFWTDRWQKMEREVDEHLAAGRRKVSEGPDEFFADLDRGLTD
jgi:AbrB family looped-hinge helix DNA binding protein